MPDSTSPFERRRSRFPTRFRLRTLLLATALLAIVFAGLADYRARESAMFRASAALRVQDDEYVLAVASKMYEKRYVTKFQFDQYRTNLARSRAWLARMPK